MTGQLVTLRDESTVTARPVRRDDKALLQDFLERLSPQSRYRRFLSAMTRLSDGMLRYLTEIDHHDHEGLIALAPDGHAVGVARFIRLPDDWHAAEAAVTVADDWQGLGLGSALTGLLANRARQEGIERFTAVMLADNHHMFDVFGEVGPVRVTGHSSGTIEVETALPEEGIGPHLREALRQTAAGRVAVRPAGDRGGGDPAGP
jgi:GNAT superfamily N-acetyltransferase